MIHHATITPPPTEEGGKICDLGEGERKTNIFLFYFKEMIWEVARV